LNERDEDFTEAFKETKISTHTNKRRVDKKKRKSKTPPRLDDDLLEDEPILEGLGSKADEIGSAAVVRIQKAQIRGLESQIKSLTERLEKSNDVNVEIRTLKQELKSATKESARAEKQLSARQRRSIA